MHRLRSELKKRISDPTLIRSNYRRLAAYPGAVDLLLGLLRRAILPDNSTIPCPVSFCPLTCSARHILTCNDAAHLEALAEYRSLGDTNRIFGRDLSVCEIISLAAQADIPALKLISVRILCFVEECLAVRWAKWLLAYCKRF